MVGKVCRNVQMGRGAKSNEAGRFERITRAPEDYGWCDEGRSKGHLKTQLHNNKSRGIMSENVSPDIGVERSINTYLGCEQGCVYCYARASQSYWGLSPGQDFGSRIFLKPNAADLLRERLMQPSYKCTVIALGTNTDPYQPEERRANITRSVLRELSKFNHPVSIVTKSTNIIRDLDIIADMATRNLIKVYLSITTLKRRLSNSLEPRASTPERRLGAVRELADAGIPTGVMVAPVIPGLTDFEIESIVRVAADAGVRECGYAILRLPHEMKKLFKQWLMFHQPLSASRVLALVREVHGGQLYNPTFGLRRTGAGPYTKMIFDRFAYAVRRYSLNTDRPKLDCSQFCIPNNQGELFLA